MARPTKYTPELQDRLCEKLRKGLPIATCCDLIRIDETTYYDWAAKRPEFSQAVKEARAAAQEEALECLLDARANKTVNWIPAAWFLERSNRRDWGRYDKVEQVVHQVVQPSDLLKELESEGGDK